jgi:hypothetical protein
MFMEPIVATIVGTPIAYACWTATRAPVESSADGSAPPEAQLGNVSPMYMTYFGFGPPRPAR